MHLYLWMPSISFNLDLDLIKESNKDVCHCFSIHANTHNSNTKLDMMDTVFEFDKFDCYGLYL